MKYSTKLYVSALSVSVLSSCLALGIVEVLTRNYLFKYLSYNLSSIAGTTAVLLDGDKLKEIRTLDDKKKPEYRQIQIEMQKARDMNRGKDIYIKYLYTTYPDPKDPQKFIFAVDSEEDEKNYSPPGSEDPGATKNRLYEHLNETFTVAKPYTDPWGTWMTGYSPVYDSQGNYVATVGADIAASLVQKNLNLLLLYALIAFIISLAETLIVVAFHAKKVTRALKLLEQATGEVRKGNFRFRLYLKSNDEFEDLGNMMNQMNVWLEENEKLKRGFAHYISQNMSEKLLQERGTGKLEGELRKITILYCHIRNFNQFAKSLGPQGIMTFLNNYFQRVLRIIFKYDGMLDKLVGDGIIAEFGIPLEDPNQEKNAVLAAIEMQKESEKIVAEWSSKSSVKIAIAIGIHTGETIVGTIDSENKLEYTSIGDTLNVATQIEKAVKEGIHPIIVTESTLKALNGQFPAQELQMPLLTDTGEAIKVYNLL